MTTIANIAALFVALLHVYFLVLEVFLWDKPYGLRTFSMTPEYAAASKKLAANQGLYNGVLAAGLLWGLGMGTAGYSTILFFLVSIVVVGVFGGWTVNRKIFWVQALPAAVATALVALSGNAGL